MIEKLVHTDIADFDRAALIKLKPYFDLNVSTCSRADRELWYRNLLTLAQHDLSIAHCVQHNHHPRSHIEVKFQNDLPDFYDPVYENQIGCFATAKPTDSLTLNGNILTGTKHWISLVDRADFGLFRVRVSDGEVYVLLDFAKAKPVVDMSYTTPIGMHVARPGSITLNNYQLPPNSIIAHYKKYPEYPLEFFHVTNMTTYCFTTNYLGIVMSLYQDLGKYIEQSKINVDHSYKKLGLAVSSLQMIWEDNLVSVHTDRPNDQFWHRRDTQYTQSKNILLDIINLILQVGDSSWVDAYSPNNRRFRDALTFSSHLKPLYRNLQEKNFFQMTTAG